MVKVQAALNTRPEKDKFAKPQIDVAINIDNFVVIIEKLQVGHNDSIVA